MYKIVIFISFNPFVFHIIRTGIIELKITNWLLTFFGISFFLATTMFLVFRKFWNLLVRKVARSTNREIELTRLLEHISRSLIQPFRRFVASDRVNSKPIRCGLSDYTLFHHRLKSDSIEALTRARSFLSSVLSVFLRSVCFFSFVEKMNATFFPLQFFNTAVSTV